MAITVGETDVVIVCMNPIIFSRNSLAIQIMGGGGREEEGRVGVLYVLTHSSLSLEISIIGGQMFSSLVLSSIIMIGSLR